MTLKQNFYQEAFFTFCRESCWKKQPSFLCLLNESPCKFYFNWLCKHVEKIRSSQDFILRNSCSELIFSLWVSSLCKFQIVSCRKSETYSEPSQTFKMELFCKNKKLTILDQVLNSPLQVTNQEESNWEISKNTIFYRTSLGDCFWCVSTPW